MKNNSKPYMPRVVCRMNTGTRVVWSKKDKSLSRRSLNKAVRDMWR